MPAARLRLGYRNTRVDGIVVWDRSQHTRIGIQTLKAITQRRYGGPEVLALEEVDKPDIEPGYVRVRVRAQESIPVSGTRWSDCPMWFVSWDSGCVHPRP